MPCTTPGCHEEREPHTIDHRILYREQPFVLEEVPAEICPGCGDVVIGEETRFEIEERIDEEME